MKGYLSGTKGHLCKEVHVSTILTPELSIPNYARGRNLVQVFAGL